MLRHAECPARSREGETGGHAVSVLTREGQVVESGTPLLEAQLSE